jgi:hypothetical protein
VCFTFFSYDKTCAETCQKFSSPHKNFCFIFNIETAMLTCNVTVFLAITNTTDTLPNIRSVNPRIGFTLRSVRSAHFWAKFTLTELLRYKGNPPLPPFKNFSLS